MALVPFAVPGEVPGLREVCEEIDRARPPNPARAKGAIANVAKVLGHSPEALAVQQRLIAFVIDRSVVPDRLRALAALQTAASLRCPYIFRNNTARARKGGLSEAQIRAIADGSGEELDERERAVLAYARQAAGRTTVPEETLQNLLRLFELKEVSELILTVAAYHFTAAIATPLDVEFDAPPATDPQPGG